METPKSILEKIRKLQRFQEDAERRGSEEEATNAALRIQDLLTKYNIALEDVGTGEAEVGQEDCRVLEKKEKSEGTWRTDLLRVLARTNFCSTGRYSATGDMGSKWILILIGEEHNREVVKDLFQSLVPRIKSLAKQAWKEYNGPEKRNAFLRGFYLGCSNRIGQRLIEAMETVKESEPQTQALVLKKDAKLNTYIQQNFGRGRATRGRSLSGIGGMQAGRAAGDKVSVNRGVAGRSSQRMLN